MADETPRRLHIYAQFAWHDEAYIIGDRKGLEALRDAIDTALRGGVKEPPWGKTGASLATVEAADGEGYNAVVALEDSPGDGPVWRDLHLPYRGWVREGHRDEEIYPALLPAVMRCLGAAYGGDEDELGIPRQNGG